ncbi:hypothetical protein REPUB_Repub02eG0213300 [Reevesia pubescens]
MIPSKKGCVLFTSSDASLVCIGVSHAYTTSKHAVVGLTKSLGVELGEYGIRVNCISPHAIAIPLLLNTFGISDKRGRKDDFYNSSLDRDYTCGRRCCTGCSFLASDEAKCLTGVNFFG